MDGKKNMIPIFEKVNETADKEWSVDKEWLDSEKWVNEGLKFNCLKRYNEAI